MLVMADSHLQRRGHRDNTRQLNGAACQLIVSSLDVWRQGPSCYRQCVACMAAWRHSLLERSWSSPSLLVRHHDNYRCFQRRRRSKKWARQKVAIFDRHCKFTIEKILCAQNFNFVSKFLRYEDFSPEFCILDVNFVTRILFYDKFRTAKNLGCAVAP